MPDNVVGGWASLDGNEIVNSQRTVAYIKNLGLPLTIQEDCWCSDIQSLVGCEAPTGYTFPSTDNAPWYDPAVPESGDFAGFLPVEGPDLSSTFTRPTTELMTGGSVLGRLRAQQKVMTWRGFLVGRTCCAAQYGLRWLASTFKLAGGCDGCEGSTLDMLYCCPEISGQVEASCRPSANGVIAPPTGTIKNSDAFRQYRNVGLTDGPKVLSERRLGCGSKGDCPEGGCMLEVQFTFTAGNPYGHKDIVPVCADSKFTACNQCVNPVIPNWVKVEQKPDKTYPVCGEPLDCKVDLPVCGDDPTCPDPILPTIPPFKSDCGCDALFPTQFCCPISNDIGGQFFCVVPTIEIFSGALPLRNLEIRFFENPQERPCNEINNPCFLCDVAKIRYIAPNSTLKIDGTNRRISIECIGNQVEPGEKLLTAPFNWPEICCINYCICVTTDCSYPIAPDHTINISVTPRDI